MTEKLSDERLTELRGIAEAVAAVTPCTCTAQRARALRAEGKLNLIRDTLSNAPECDKYDDDDVIVCGWKRDMQNVRAILDGDSNE